VTVPGKWGTMYSHHSPKGEERAIEDQLYWDIDKDGKLSPSSKAKPASKAKKAAEEEKAEEKKAVEEQKKPEAIPEEQDELMEDGDATVTLKAIELGDTLPEITLKNEKGEDVDVSKIAGEKGAVFFLVPKANTPGCTKQACGFRDNYDDFTKLGYNVYSLSADSSIVISNWQTKQNLQYTLLSDPNRELIGALGAGKAATTRSHFVFEKGTGKLVEKKLNVKPTESPTQALDFVKKHHA